MTVPACQRSSRPGRRGHIPNEQVQTVGTLVEMTVSQMMGRQRAGGDVVGFSAGAGCFLVSAIMKMPIAVQLRATWASGQIFAD